MARLEECESLHTVFREFLNLCLINDKSLLWPDKAIWTLENLIELKRRIYDSPEFGKERSFEEKLTLQLDGASPELWGIISDIYYVYFLPSVSITLKKKQKDITWAASKGSLQPPKYNSNIRIAQNQGYIKTYVQYHIKYRQFWLILLFAIHVKEHIDANSIITDYSTMQNALDTILDQIPNRGDRGEDMRHGILYMAFPDYYEGMISTRYKKKIVETYASILQQPLASDLDENLRAIRGALGKKYDKPDRPFDFYEDLESEWRTGEKPDSKFLAESLSKIFSNLEAADWAFDFLLESLNRLGIDNPEDKRFAITLSHDATVLRLNFGNVAALQFYGPTYSNYAIGVALIDDGEDLPEDHRKWDTFAKIEPRISVYEFPIEFLKQPQTELRNNYKSAFSILAGQFQDCTASNLRSFHQPEIARAVFDTGQRNILLRKGFDPPQSPTDTYSLADCSRDTGFEIDILESWVRAIDRKGQAIIYGPPGTGKTYIAEKIAKHLISGGHGFSDLVQFHPSYSYGDFIQGIRPISKSDGTLSCPVVPGRFLDFCEKSEKKSGTCVLIIDEINRANLSRVFGKLMYLLEYRDREVPLAVGGTLRIPRNVLIIGTMNTADRSMALVDHALRRRFAFLSLSPDYHILRRYYAENDFKPGPLIGVLKHRQDTHIYP